MTLAEIKNAAARLQGAVQPEDFEAVSVHEALFDVLFAELRPEAPDSLTVERRAIAPHLRGLPPMDLNREIGSCLVWDHEDSRYGFVFRVSTTAAKGAIDTLIHLRHSTTGWAMSVDSGPYAPLGRFPFDETSGKAVASLISHVSAKVKAAVSRSST